MPEFLKRRLVRPRSTRNVVATAWESRLKVGGGPGRDWSFPGNLLLEPWPNCQGRRHVCLQFLLAASGTQPSWLVLPAGEKKGNPEAAGGNGRILIYMHLLTM